ncbi:MAG: hypothetical protein M1814_006281 [Vezdaea aestivalis]|nr:MAG: hypothetical protein M1814_006281 [Vezdaea aestivalis]
MADPRLDATGAVETAPWDGDQQQRPSTSSQTPSYPPAEKGPAPTPASPTSETSKPFNDIQIGVNVLLNRLKQSIASTQEFASFLKKRSTLEEIHAQGLKKLCRSTHETTRRPDNRQGSYVKQFDQVIRIHDRMSDNGNNFALSLHQMHEDLNELAANMDRGRKQWKSSSALNEKKASDSEALMVRAKAKYDSLAEDYDRAKTGDKSSGKIFGRKGPQHEEELHRKLQAAEAEYQAKVTAASGNRQELWKSHRPTALKKLQDLITECDSALVMQLQKYASFNEKLLLNNGMCVSPLRPQGESPGLQALSLRQAALNVDNEKDLKTYILSQVSKTPPTPADIKFERHPTLASPTTQVPSSSSHRQSQQFSRPTQPSMPPQAQQPPIQEPYRTGGPPPPHMQEPMRAPTGFQPPERGFTPQGPPINQNYGPIGSNGPHHASQPSFSGSPGAVVGAFQGLPPPGPPQNGLSYGGGPPPRPVFGVSLESLFNRDGSAVPMPVSQCIQAVDLYGLEVEGIYRLSGTASHIERIKSVFDHDAGRVDFRNPEHFFHDVNSVAGALKQFLRELPDPLLTMEHYKEFVDAARIDDDTVRRDSLHAIINSLPDSNYATLRALALHLKRVQDRSQTNRMNAGNLAICFGPTLMGQNSGGNIADAGFQVRVIDTILQNTDQIFEDD